MIEAGRELGRHAGGSCSDPRNDWPDLNTFGG